MPRETQKQLEDMIKFLELDLESDQEMIDNPKKYGLSWYMRFKIRQQMRTTRKQIQHFKDKIAKYDKEGWI